MCINCQFKNSLYSRENPFLIRAEDDCCKLAVGYYCAYGYKHRAMECEEWAELCDFMTLLRRARFMNFSVQSNRDAILNSFMNLKVEAPFALDRRFPLNKVYVNLTCSGYSEFIRQVAQALNQKDREKEVDRKANASSANSEVSNLKFTFDDASSGFHKGIQQLLSLACKRHETYGRLEFEAKYDLKWCEGVPPVIDPPVVEPPTNPGRTYLDLKSAMRREFSRLEDFELNVNNRGVVQCVPNLESTNVTDLSDTEVIGTRYVLIYASAALTQCRNEVDIRRITVFQYDSELDSFVRFPSQEIGASAPLSQVIVYERSSSSSEQWRELKKKGKKKSGSNSGSGNSFEVLEDFNS